MSPKPQDGSPAELLDNAIVISGMAGLYPESQNVKDFRDILYNKVNPVTSKDCRWKYDHPEVAQYTGKVPGLDLFDAQFFKVHYRLGNTMDSMSRKLLEQSFEAIYDAGVNSDQLSGKKVGVYVGSCFSETEKYVFYITNSKTGFGIMGSSKTMFANRISYWLNTKGPSMSIDQSCCSSVLALELAYQAMNRGDVDAALVGGASLCLLPQSSVHLRRVVLLSRDGKTRSFDKNACGCAKSEAINVLFVQKAKDARRIYAEVVYAKSEFSGFVNGQNGPKYGFYREPEKLESFLNQFYKEAQVDPKEVQYVEAAGSATPEADKAELEAIDKVFCKNRSDPLHVGSVMSNIGYGEAASGISSITKVLLGYESGLLASNLHCDNLRDDLEGIEKGVMRFVTDHQPFGRGYTAINNLSVTGVNAHVLLKGHYKPKNLNRYKSNIPHLVTISGRQQSSVEKILNDLKSRPIDPEEIALLHNIHQNKISGHMGRGYVILDTTERKETVTVAEKADYFDDVTNPLWFVYSGMGSQWAGMGTELMRIPVFAIAIQRCHEILKPKGLDLINIITSPDKKIFDNILHSFVGIAAVQIGLTDVLTELGIVPDKIIGHSVGELGCAYADGCLTAEETILSAYSRGLVSVQTPFIKGSMAAVGLGYSQVAKMCPPEVEIACHNSSESATISGPADIMQELVASFTAKGIFAKEVPCSNIAYHSRYIANAGPALLKYLKEVIKTPVARSSRWVSTSIPQDKWDEPLAKYSSAEYHTNNLLNPVLFEEASALIPANAVLVEVAPHGLLQAILKRALSSCVNIPLTNRGHKDNAAFMLDAIGKLYMKGYNPKVQALYPKVEFPVSTGTPMLGHLIEWEHSEKWSVPVYVTALKKTAAACNFALSVHDDEHNYLRGHVVKGKNVYPYSAALMAVWDTFAMSLNNKRKCVSVQFKDVHLFVQPKLYDKRPLKLSVTLHKGNGVFEVSNEGMIVAKGVISLSEKSNDIYRLLVHPIKNDDKITLKTEDIYKLLYTRDYNYRCGGVIVENVKFRELSVLKNNGISLKALQFAPHFPKDRTDETVALHIYLQIVNENINKDEISIFECIDDVTRESKFNGIHKIIEDVPKLRAKYSVLREDKLQEFADWHNIDVIFVNNLYSNEKGEWGGLYYLPINELPKANNNVILQSAQIGDINSLEWVEAPEVTGPGINVNVHYAGVNDIDIKRASGEVSYANVNKNYYGMDFSGVTDNGVRVMGLVKGGAITSRVKANSNLLWPVPDTWNLEDAATVPLAYAQAFYCLAIKQKLFPGMNILIHGGTGALGQAAISICLAHNCEVFTTVSDKSKKHFLKRLFPKLKDDHIGNSRDVTFGDMVLSCTQGYGCDIILNCVKGELKNISIKCCAPSGIVIDTGMVQTNEDFSYGMYNMTKSRSFAAVDISSIFKYNNETDMKHLQVLISEGIARGYVRPLTRLTFAPSDAARAFRLLAASRHRGRVLIDMKQNIPNTKTRVWEKKGVHIELTIESVWEKNVTFNTLDDNSPSEVEGIYAIITNNNNSENIISSLDNLDAKARKIDSKLKYFAVINENHMIGENICLVRRNCNLPATFIKIPLLKQNDNGQSLSTKNVFDAIERAILSKKATTIAHISSPSTHLLQEICTLAEIKLPEVADDDTTLNQLRVESSKVSILQAYLRDQYDIWFEKDTILDLTVQKLREIQEMIFEKDFVRTKGLATFYSSVDRDELLATTEINFLPTLTNSSAMAHNEFDASQVFLCTVPGVEGNHARFSVLCERLKLPALVLQPPLGYAEDLHTMAQRFAEKFLQLTELKKFYLLGYESGVIVALEMAAILEKHGLTGVVFCLGGLPNEIQAQFETQLIEYKDEDALQEEICRHMMTLITESKTEMFENMFHKAMAWPEKLNACARSLLGKVEHSAEYTKELIESAYSRIAHVRNYVVEPKKLKSKLILLRPKMDISDEFQGMVEKDSPQNYSEQPIVEYQLDAPLANATQDMRCAAIVNRHLEEGILKAFEQKNLCKTYFLTQDSSV
ncbi:fatty acid synthase-like [Zerene cesonia]|uniref:fatty acid synthase-like n=1 Tax=Zerene cesonia TaxID=33412 RepID=UPI0018E54465|nr:fatty acid synthase-like [Zerene cesonia]